MAIGEGAHASEGPWLLPSGQHLARVAAASSLHQRRRAAPPVREHPDARSIVGGRAFTRRQFVAVLAELARLAVDAEVADIDQAEAHANGTPYAARPRGTITGRQMDYVMSLLEDRADPAEHSAYLNDNGAPDRSVVASLSSRDASQLIGSLLS